MECREKTWNSLLPSAWRDVGLCPYYAKDEKVRLARGFRGVMERLKNREHRYVIRMAMTEYLGSKGSYYRYRDGERLLSPEQQQWIVDLFAQCGYTEGVVFDDYEEDYLYEAIHF